jgi:leucyl/phenylalanyl-tRNA--protein transferase
MENGEFPYFSEHERFRFPPVSESTPEGIVASGGNLSPGMLISAYSQGIFPWYTEGEPILWWSPDPRFILWFRDFHISKSLRKVLKQNRFSVTLDSDFPGVIGACRDVPRRGQTGTWITDEMTEGYLRLRELGYAHSVEVRQAGDLVGGLYGVSLGANFFGESMFSFVSNASKTALVYLVAQLSTVGFDLIDSQVYTAHLERLGAGEIPREEYMKILEARLQMPTIRGNWGEKFPRMKTSNILALNFAKE